MFFTDPERTPDPAVVAARLPRGSGIVFRHFGAPDAEAQARILKAVARARSLKLLIGQDASLAAEIGADGVHLPERLAHRAQALRRARPDWIVTSAAHSLAAARRAQGQAVVVSVALPSQSRSANAALGPVRLAAMARACPRPVYALGGINNRTARRLLDAGLFGLAAVEGLAN